MDKVKKYFSIKIKNLRTNWLATTVVGLATLLMGVFIWQGWRHFQFPVLDLGLYNRHMWGLVRLDFSANPLKGFNLLGDHAHFILFLLAPVYALFQSPATLLVVQVLCISLSGWPIYLIARKYFKNRTIAALWLIPYFMYFGFWSALAYPFHVSAIAVLPLAWALYFMLEKNYRYLVPTVILMVLTKEEMPLVAIMMGLYIIVIQRKYWLGAIMAGLSGLYFIFVLKFWLPSVSGIRYYYTDTSVPLKTALLQPTEFVKAFLQPKEKFKNIAYMLTSFAGFSLLGIEILILLLPIWMGRFLSTQDWRWTYGQHYSANQGPILVVAAIIGIARLVFILGKAYEVKKKYLSIIMLVAPIICIFTSAIVWKKLDLRTMRIHREWLNVSLNNTQTSAWKAIELIPKNKSLGVTSAFPQATSRKVLYNLPTDLESNQPEYLLLSTQLDIWPFMTPNDVLKYIEQARSLGYTTALEENGVFLLKKK